VKILVLSDASINANTGGFSQTLYNIFSFIEPENFLLITSSSAYKEALPSAPFTSRTVVYKFEIIKPKRNRIGIYINRYIDAFNFNINYRFRSFKKIKKAIHQFNPDVIITAPNGQVGLFMHNALKPLFENKKVYPYFMDDWLHKPRMKWIGGSIHALAKKILNENKAWMMVSKNLADVFIERYKVKPERILEIHNPVKFSGNEQIIPLEKKQHYTFAYAGALWQMHFDAFTAVAKAIKMLQAERDISLIVYTQESQWEWRKKEMELLPVIYGGNIPYSDIHEKLSAADFLIITSSFHKEYYTHSKASVQTKLTDYLKAGRLIISCGPPYSVNHEFLKKYDCGICIETTDENKIAANLNTILENPFGYNQYILNGIKVLKEEFTLETVQKRLQKFLEAL